MKNIIVLLFLFALCGAIEEKSHWWNHTTVYEIPVIWYKDSNNDGIGDLKGLTSKLDYLQDTGVSVIKLSPVYSSSEQIADDYPVEDFYSIHPVLGTMEDFNEMMGEAKKRDIKVVLDINLNHCHSLHEWFQKSIKKIEPYTDYFVWKDRKIVENDDPDINRPPNDWENTHGQKSWKWNSDRKQFYYNYFNRFSPDLNLRNPKVVEEILKIVKFWFDKGVSGFYLLHIYSYLDDEEMTNKKRLFKEEDLFKFVSQLRQPMKTYNELNPGNERILMTEPHSYKEEEIAKYVDLFELITIRELSKIDLNDDNITERFTAEKGLKSWLNLKSKRSNYEWLLDSAASYRISSYRNKETAHILLMIQAQLSGVMHIFYGAEIGMGEHQSRSRICVNTKWEYDNNRTLPMQWDTSVNAGFSKSSCLLQKVNPEYTLVNVETQTGNKLSTYNFVKTLLKLRSDPVLNYGGIKFLALSKTVLAISRKYQKTTLNVLVNLNNIPEVVQLEYSMYGSSYSIQVLAGTPNSYYQEGDVINPTARFVMRPMSGIAWKFTK